MEVVEARFEVLKDVAVERDRQTSLWGTERDILVSHDKSIQNYLWQKYVVLGEEVGEIARGILEKKLDNIYDECIQVAAVSTAIAECLKMELGTHSGVE